MAPSHSDGWYRQLKPSLQVSLAKFETKFIYNMYHFQWNTRYWNNTDSYVKVYAHNAIYLDRDIFWVIFFIFRDIIVEYHQAPLVIHGDFLSRI